MIRAKPSSLILLLAAALILLLAAAPILLLAAAPAAAGEVRLDGPLTQGGLVKGHVPPGAEVRLDGARVRVSADGLFVIGFGRDARRQARLEIRYRGGTAETRVLEIAQRRYPVERVDGLPSNMVSPSANELARIRKEAAWIAQARRRDSAATWFAAGFIWPVKGPITGVYGSGRILNGEPRRPHFGVDIKAPAGTPVAAPGSGVVALAEPDLFFTGGTVMIDHGHGVTSIFLHLSAVNVTVDQIVKQGDVIGAVGSTGRATGPHLDWRVNWFTRRLDPALLAGPMPAE